ncbi:MAG: Asp-tRNA(Asn)/Glu-tRNA(Gln) amidotransferase GatCAB subunit B, partial [Desulfobacterales bacterium]
RFMETYHLPAYDADILTSSRELANYFEACLTDFPNPKQVSNWMMGSLTGLLNSLNKSISESPISSKDLAQLLQLIDDKTISSKIAKTVFDEMAQTGKSPKEIVAEKGLVQMTDKSAIKEIVENVLERCSMEVNDYKNGKTKLLGFFVGQVMKETKGKANPKIVNELLKKILSE